MKFIAEVMPVENAPLFVPFIICDEFGNRLEFGYKVESGSVFHLENDCVRPFAKYCLKFTPITDSI